MPSSFCAALLGPQMGAQSFGVESSQTKTGIQDKGLEESPLFTFNLTVLKKVSYLLILAGESQNKMYGANKKGTFKNNRENHESIPYKSVSSGRQYYLTGQRTLMAHSSVPAAVSFL